MVLLAFPRCSEVSVDEIIPEVLPINDPMDGKFLANDANAEVPDNEVIAKVSVDDVSVDAVFGEVPDDNVLEKAPVDDPVDAKLPVNDITAQIPVGDVVANVSDDDVIEKAPVDDPEDAKQLLRDKLTKQTFLVFLLDDITAAAHILTCLY